MIQRYQDFLDQYKNVPIYYNSWWLDVVCGNGNWFVIFAELKDVVVAVWPIPFNTENKTIRTPVLTQRLGPLIAHPENQKYETKLAFEKKVYSLLIDKLPPFAELKLNFDYEFTNWLPFYWKGYRQTTRYSYVIENMMSLEAINNDLKSSARGKVRKGERAVDLVIDESLEDFYKINSLTFQRQNMKMPYSFDLLKKMDEALKSNNQRIILFAKDKEDGRYHSALYLMWDDHTSYLHLMGDDPELRNSGAGMFLIWEAIKYTFQELKIERFDFEGSMIEGIEEVRRSFGAVQKQYFQISKTNSKILKIKEFVKSLRS
jgi:hypothetical protein